MTYVKALLISLVALFGYPAVAGPYTTAAGTCLTDNTTGKERKELARWIFMAMAAHPEMRDLTTASAEARDKTDQSMGKLVTRLLSENCAAQTRAAVKNEGSESLKAAFGILGQLAMQEIMSNAEVNASIGGFEKYLDKQKLESALSTK
ncbi:hypothetical protein VVD49_00055 [Uliginosibacterium sp. H3]|uniref:Uncharacterized protein n=1 Tax=Uliginosibacterium silvisoli TaxID=3114758 RepID=A0ABU6JXU2_9RHOO|nr:hypothetical protein [Uliginosibacterium sp. H3]